MISSSAPLIRRGSSMRERFGAPKEGMLTINPDTDLWLVSFSTVEESSGEHLIASGTWNQHDIDSARTIRRQYRAVERTMN